MCVKFESRTPENKTFAANSGIRFFFSETRKVLCIAFVLGTVLMGAVVAAVLLWKFSECGADTPELERAWWAAGAGARLSPWAEPSALLAGLPPPTALPEASALEHQLSSLCLSPLMVMHE